jgi:hypothetical protein
MSGAPGDENQQQRESGRSPEPQQSEIAIYKSRLHGRVQLRAGGGFFQFHVDFRKIGQIAAWLGR